LTPKSTQVTVQLKSAVIMANVYTSHILRNTIAIALNNTVARIAHLAIRPN